MAAKINANPAWAGVKQIDPNLLKNASPARDQATPTPKIEVVGGGGGAPRGPAEKFNI